MFLVFALLVWGRVFYLQRSHFMEAERYLAANNLKLAMREFDTAMHFHFPLSPYTGESAERLWEIGEAYEKGDALDWALMAYSSIRSSLYATRSFYTPGRNWIDRCDQKIADLSTRILVKEGSLKPEDVPVEKAKHLKVLKTDRPPSVLWSALAEIGFFGWVASVLLTAFRGFEKNGSLRRRPALLGAVSFLGFLALWAVSLLMA